MKHSLDKTVNRKSEAKTAEVPMGMESSGSDFDNIYIRLKKQYNDDLARSFTCNSELWVAWIERNAAST